VARGFDHGLILNAPAGNVIRLTPPLVISDDEMNAAVEKLTELLTELNKENRS
jgi:acetylornithine aminotransferase